MKMADFFCRIVKDCATNDGIREYEFTENVDAGQFKDILEPLGDVKQIVGAGGVLLRVYRPDYYRINCIINENKMLVMYENDLYPEARPELEKMLKAV